MAALALAERLDTISDQDRVIQWLLDRQIRNLGFQGRPSKDADVCYSFWCGASLQILGAHSYIDSASDVAWILSAQSPMSGIAKTPGELPDVLHSYLGYVALSMHQHELEGPSLPFAPVSAALNISRESLDWLYSHLWTRKASYIP